MYVFAFLYKSLDRNMYVVTCYCKYYSVWSAVRQNTTQSVEYCGTVLLKAMANYLHRASNQTDPFLKLSFKYSISVLNKMYVGTYFNFNLYWEIRNIKAEDFDILIKKFTFVLQDFHFIYFNVHFRLRDSDTNG